MCPAVQPARTTPAPALRRQLGLAAVFAVVVGDMLGSGVFFTPGELAAVAEHAWQVYLIWTLCGLITLCAALTLAELSALLPRPGASYHIIREGFGPFWAFLKVWMEMWVSGPGSVAGVAIVFGEFAARLAPAAPATVWGAGAILVFAAINALGVQWGGRTQVVLTAVKIAGVLALVGGALLLAPAVAPATPVAGSGATVDAAGLARFIGLGVAVVLFTYDGWIDVSHVAGEVERPERNLPLGLGAGVAALMGLYLVVNYAFLRAVPLDAMRAEPTTVATTVAYAAFGPRGGPVLNGLIVLSIFGALGGLVMTLPRLYYTVAAGHVEQATGLLRRFLGGLAIVSPRTAVPVGAIVFTAAWSIVALAFFGSFSRLVTFFLVPLHLSSILMISAVFRLRRRVIAAGLPYRTPGHPVTPVVYIVVLLALLASAVVFQPVDTLIGLGLAATGVPAYRWLRREEAR